MLRRNTGVPPHEDRAPASMHSGSGRGCAKGGGAAQAQHVPGAREGRPAKTAGPRLGDRGPLERNSAALRSRPRPPPSSLLVVVVVVVVVVVLVVVAVKIAMIGFAIVVVTTNNSTI